MKSYICTCRKPKVAYDFDGAKCTKCKKFVALEDK